MTGDLENNGTQQSVQQDATSCNIGQDRLNGEAPSENKSGENESRENGVTPQQVRAVDLLASGKPLGEIARELQIDRTTLWRWRQERCFRKRFVQELWSDARARMLGMLDPAIDVLCQQMTDCYDRTRFRAAATVLRLAGLAKVIH